MHLCQRNKHLTLGLSVGPLYLAVFLALSFYFYKVKVQMEGLSSQTVCSTLSWWHLLCNLQGGRFLRIWMNDLRQKKFKFFCHQHPSMILSKSRPCWAPNPTPLPTASVPPCLTALGRMTWRQKIRTGIEGCNSQCPDKSGSPNKLFARRCFIYYRRIRQRWKKEILKMAA